MYKLNILIYNIIIFITEEIIEKLISNIYIK